MEAVRLGRLPLVSRRLSTKERTELIKEGAVFVWEESDYRGGVDRGGIERWTDGLKWSQSRMHEPFLLYEEKAEVPKDENGEKVPAPEKKTGDAASRARRANRPNKPNGLTKQTYSALLRMPNGATTPQDTKPPKWHLTCYFRRPDHVNLPTVESDPVLREVRPNPNTFTTAKGLTRRKTSAASLDPSDDALARLHPGGNPSLNASVVSLGSPGLSPSSGRSPGSPGESDTDASQSPIVSPQPHSPYDTARWGSPWSASSASVASATSSSASPLTPPASYGIPAHGQHSPTSPYPSHYGYHYMHPAVAAAAQAAAQQAHYAVPTPNCAYHMFPGSSTSTPSTTAAPSPREGMGMTLPPIRQVPDITRHLPPPLATHHAHAVGAQHAGLGMAMPMQAGSQGSTVTYGGEQFGNAGVTYDPSRGYYVERRMSWAEAAREE